MVAGPPSPIAPAVAGVAVARDRPNQARGLGDDPDAVVQRVRDVEVAVPGHGHRVRPVERRLRRLHVVAIEAAHAIAGDRDDLAVDPLDAADAMVLGVGDIQVAVGGDRHVCRRRERQFGATRIQIAQVT